MYDINSNIAFYNKTIIAVFSFAMEMYMAFIICNTLMSNVTMVDSWEYHVCAIGNTLEINVRD